MRKSVLSLLAGTAMTTLAFSAASAADLPIREAPPAPMIQAVPVFTWTGFYIGVNAGAGWRDNNQESVFLTGPGIPGGLEGGILFFPNNGNDAVFVGGGQIGYNLQIGSFVVGVETDIQWADTDDGQNAVFIPGPGFPAGATFIPGSFEIGQDWFGTVRARAGVASTPRVVWPTRTKTPAGRLVAVSNGLCRSACSATPRPPSASRACGSASTMTITIIAVLEPSLRLVARL
jgi:outer membrane immunogenic protein